MISEQEIHNASVLIVDDLDAHVQVLTRLLVSAGYTSVTSTMNPLEVCELHRSHYYDLILLDLHMPGMDGFHVMEGLKEIESDGYLSVIVTTAYPEHKLRALRAGAKDFINKPFDQPDVLARVHNMLEIRLLHNEVNNYNDELEQKVIERTASLEQAMLELEQASRGKDEFLAAISHELKTPLNHILGFSDLLKKGLVGELNEEQKGMAQDIFDAGSRQLAIVNSLIELARLQSGKMKLQTKPEEPAKILGEIATRYAAQAQAAGLDFAVEVAEELGEMMLDREVVSHLLDQLLSNALKFTPSGGKVSLAARRVSRTDVTAPVRVEADEYLELAVADNGPGIAPETLPRLFQSFVQGDGRLARNHGGTGVGLVLVRLLAELHGGGSSVESEHGAGARFLVWLPLGKRQQ